MADDTTQDGPPVEAWQIERSDDLADAFMIRSPSGRLSYARRQGGGNNEAMIYQMAVEILRLRHEVVAATVQTMAPLPQSLAVAKAMISAGTRWLEKHGEAA